MMNLETKNNPTFFIYIVIYGENCFKKIQNLGRNSNEIL
jgi:hypothetical protein